MNLYAENFHCDAIVSVKLGGLSSTTELFGMTNNYLQFHLELLQQTYNQLIAFSPFTKEDLAFEDDEFLSQFRMLIASMSDSSNNYIDAGQSLLNRWIRNYPELVPLMPRDLLWFFGGDCLHYMPDEEIEQFQRLDEKRYEAESCGKTFEYSRERALILGLLH